MGTEALANRLGLRHVWIPAALYLAIFFLLNPHLIGTFSSHYFFGGADGYQNVWNLWWVNKAIGELGTHPWSTTFLHYPDGTSLVGHTLNPFNGLIGMVLLEFLTMVQTYNTIVVFSFVMTGVTAYWLCLEMTASYAGSLLGGAVFTFSSFHFMHADAHLQLVALQWLPLFILCWIRYCEQPSIGRGAGAAMVLFLVVLCDFYYFAYCVFTAVFFLAWKARRDRDYLFLFRRRAWPSLLGFAIPTLLTSGVLVAALVYQQATDPLFGTHSPRDLSMDLLSPFVWGYYWRFRDWVQPLWFPLSNSVTEASVHAGLSVIALSVYAWTQRSRTRIAHLPFWLCVALFFAVMSLGPNLHVGGHELSLGLRTTVMGRDNVNVLVLPYAVLWLLFPPWRLAGVPLRMMVMVQLVAAILAAGGLRALLTSSWRWKRAAVTVLLALVVFDYLPTPTRLTDPGVPYYVEVLKTLPEGAVLDLASSGPLALYYQTVHQKPIAFGYISRTPASVDRADLALAALIVDGQWERIAHDYHFRYVVKGQRAADVMMRGVNGIPLVEIDPARKIYSSNGIDIYQFIP